MPQHPLLRKNDKLLQGRSYDFIVADPKTNERTTHSGVIYRQETPKDYEVARTDKDTMKTEIYSINKDDVVRHHRSK